MEKNAVLKDYSIMKTLGKGKFSKVKLAKHLPTDELVAVKMVCSV